MFTLVEEEIYLCLVERTS